MKCYNPLKYIDNGYDKKTYKRDIVIIKSKTARKHKPGQVPIFDTAKNLPCGKCQACKLSYSQEWANRAGLEIKNWKHNVFVTLTYNNENLPKQNVRLENKETGEVYKQIPSLKPKDLTKFMKDLREYYRKRYNHINIRFMGAGEYGSETKRPHYHLIIFNLPITDLKPKAVNYDNDIYYDSEIIKSIWKKGHVSITNATHENAAYVARYTMKKQQSKVEQKQMKKLGLEPEFLRMSRSPGIGGYYYEKHKKKIWENDHIIITTKKGAKKITPPKYFTRLLEKENAKKAFNLKEVRRKNIEIQERNLKYKDPSRTPEQQIYESFINTGRKALILKNYRKGVTNER